MGSADKRRRGGRFVTVAAFAAYPVLAHVALTRNDPRWAGAGLAILVWGLLLNTLPAVWAAVVAGGAVAGIAWLAPGFPDLVLRASPVVINLALCAFFGLTLRRGHDPLITRFARLEHDPLPAAVETYTRRLTVLWTLFFAAMAAITVALEIVASRPVYSLFSNVINWLLLLAFLIGEYLYRHVRFPSYRHKPPHAILKNLSGGSGGFASRRRDAT
ncbi:MAG TPA: hypothetical protein VJ829_15440 [Candidatus Binatia bacterium]|nr:hypothetical protein [Candidatus Binatia bacterium]